MTATAGERWAEQLASWAIPDEILAAAPESPWALPPSRFAVDRRAAGPETPARRAALDALGGGGTVLDVGAGAGAASLPLAPPATHVTAVDQSEAMLAAFAAEASARGVPHAVAQGRWPDVEEAVEAADVALAHHVLYNVPDAAPFLDALTCHARRRVVIELTERHPHWPLNPLWLRFHGIERPEGPTPADLLDVLAELGIRAEHARSERPDPALSDGERADLVAATRRRLCLTADRDAEIDDALGDDPVVVPTGVVSIWWDA